MEEQHTMEPRGEDTGSQSILEFGSSLIQSKRGTIHVLTIVGQIEGHQVLPPTSKSTKYECAHHRGTDRGAPGAAPHQQEHQV